MMTNTKHQSHKNAANSTASRVLQMSKEHRQLKHLLVAWKVTCLLQPHSAPSYNDAHATVVLPSTDGKTTEPSSWAAPPKHAV
jgi:hypothetical protein